MSALPRAVTANVISMSDVKMPDPLVPPGTRVGGDYMPMYCGAILNSEALTAMPPAARWAALRLWLEAWRSEHTTGTLPNNDKVLAQFAGYGNDTRSWLRVKQNALHKFILCSDGRLHHPVLAKAVRDLLERRAKANKRKQNQRRPDPAAGRENPEGSGQAPDACPEAIGEMPGKVRDDDGDLPVREGQNQTLSVTGHGPVPPEGKGREGKGIESSVSPSGDTGVPPDGDPPPSEVDEATLLRQKLWREGREILERIAPAMAAETVGSLIGQLAKESGGGTEGGTRAVHALRDIESRVAAGKIAGYGAAGTPKARAKIIESYIRGLIARTKAGVVKAVTASGNADGANYATAARDEILQRTLAKQTARGGPLDSLQPARGPVIDGKAEAI